MTKASILGLPDMSWHVHAACHEDNRPPEVKAEWFGPLTYRPEGSAEDEPTVRAALAVCAGCAMIERCEVQAKLDPHARGVWYGKYVTGHS